MSLTVDISLTQVALITADTAATIRRLFNDSPAMLEVARLIDQFVATRGDSLEALMHAGALVDAWRGILGTPEYREFELAHQKLRHTGNQAHVVRRLQQLDAALKATGGTRTQPRRQKGRKSASA